MRIVRRLRQRLSRWSVALLVVATVGGGTGLAATSVSAAPPPSATSGLLGLLAPNADGQPPAGTPLLSLLLPQLFPPDAPALYLDWPHLLPPRSLPYQAPTSTVCADGADDCIDHTIAEMRSRLTGLAGSCDHDAVFSLAYLRVTEDVRTAIRSGDFADRKWLNQEDATFARLYFDAYAAWHAGQADQVPVAWRIAFRAADDRSMSGLGDFLLAMNAHINRDMPYMLASIGLTTPDGRSHKADHDRYNRRLAALYTPVLREVARRFDPTADDIDIGPVDDELAYNLLEGWREIVWRNAESLAAAKTPQERSAAASTIEAYSTLQAQLIRLVFTANPGPRDAFCAVHGLNG